MQEGVKFGEAGEFEAVIDDQQSFIEVAGSAGDRLFAIWGAAKIDAEYFHGFIS